MVSPLTPSVLLTLSVIERCVIVRATDGASVNVPVEALTDQSVESVNVTATVTWLEPMRTVPAIEI